MIIVAWGFHFTNNKGEVTGPLWRRCYARISLPDFPATQPRFAHPRPRIPQVRNHTPPRTMSNLDSSKLDRFKLETSFGNGSVTHTAYTTDVVAGQRRAPVETTWVDKKTLRSGGFGVVILQETEAGELRAVKKIYTGMGKMDFSREISVMIKVAHARAELPTSGIAGMLVVGLV